MSRSLFLGSSGAGKTTACIDIFRENILSADYTGLQATSYLILPSREHSDRIHSLLLRDERFKGLANIHVLTIGDFIRYKSARQTERTMTQFERHWLTREILSRNQWKWLEPVKDAPASILKAICLAGQVVKHLEVDGGIPQTHDELMGFLQTTDRQAFWSHGKITAAGESVDKSSTNAG